MKRLLLIVLIIMPLSSLAANAEENLAEKLLGKILLQVEQNGEAWYINPGDQKKYLLGRPNDAFVIMRELGVGISNENINKIPVALVGYDDNDTDNDGIADRLEIGLGTNPYLPDSDNDGYDDLLEIESNYNPLGSGKINIDQNFAEENVGNIFIQVNNNGEAWYVNPEDKKRYFLGRPADAFGIMRTLSLGISNNDLEKISIGSLDNIIEEEQAVALPKQKNSTTCVDCQAANASSAISGAASSIRQKDKEGAKEFFSSNLHKAIDYTIDTLSDDSLLLLANMLVGANLSEYDESQAIFSKEVYFSLGEQDVNVEIYVEKQEDGVWRITRL